MKRLLSWLLALVMIISCLPLSALPAFAATETDVDTDFETEEDIIVDFAGELTPIDLTVDLLNEGDFTARVTVPAGKTYHYIAYRVNGMEMTINDGEAVACVTDGMTSPYAWTITNDGADDAEYVIKVGFPAGTLENPAELKINWDNEADIKAGSQGYYYTWTADAAGTLIVTMPKGDWSYVINNLTTNKHGDQQSSDSDPVVNPAYVSVAEGDEIQLIVNNYDPENEYNAPAGVLTFRADLNNEFNAIPVFKNGQTDTVTVPAGFTLYYQAFINGMMLTIDGGEPQLIKTANPRMPYVFPLTEGEHTLSIAHPVGTMENPAQLVIGENAASIEAGNFQGYFYTYTAEKDGILVLDIDAGEAGWTYTVDNLTTGVYGDKQWSNSDPVVNPAEIEVAAGDELQIVVNTYDAADEWNNPAGTVTVNASYKVECEYVDANQDGRCDICGEEKLDATLAFYGKGMVLGADIRGIFQVRKIKATSPYESFKVIVEKGGVETELELVATSDKTNHTTYGYAITVAAKEMADVVNARIVGITADGEAFISNPDTWSIKEGVISLMDTYASKTDEASINKMKLAANMLRYGAEAQNNFSYNLDNLATDGLSEEYAAYIITTVPEMETIAKTDDTGAIAPLTRIGFNLAERVQILPCFSVPKADAKEDYKAVINQTHIAPDGTETVYDTVVIDGADCLKSGSTFAVYVDYMASNELRDVMTVTLYKGDVAVSATHTFSAESVLNGLYSSNPDLVTALMHYGDCARAVFG